MEKFVRLTAKACPLALPNVNTDQILPGRYLRLPRSPELGHLLFQDLRRDAGCSMCIGMNDDVLPSGERSASTSNRNFEGRQGKGSRTHLVSPVMAAAAAIEGHFVDIREWDTAGGDPA